MIFGPDRYADCRLGFISSTDEKFGNQDYGFLWWLPHRTRDVIAAIGDGGNIIYIDRINQIVVAITAHFKQYIEKNIVEALIKR